MEQKTWTDPEVRDRAGHDQGGWPPAGAGQSLVRGLVHGRWRAEVLRAVLELGVADVLAEGSASTSQLAATLRVSEEALRRLLTLALECGLFSRSEEGDFSNNAASSLLLAGAPGSMRTEAAHLLATWARIAWDNLEHAVRHGSGGFQHVTGGSVFEYLQEHPADAQAFHDFQAQVTQRNAAMLQARRGFPATGTVVDVGGGNGAMLAQILEREPGLQGLLYDRPEVVAAASSAGLAAGVRDRLKLDAGDFFQEVPPGGHVYLLSHVLHDWPDDQATVILRRVAAAMTPDSELLVLENMLPEVGTSLVLAYLDVLMLTGWGGRERTLAEYRELLGGAGMAVTQAWALAPRMGLTALSARRAATD